MPHELTDSIFQKIHFIRIIDFDYINSGDIFSSPLMYTQEFFKDYSVITHNISSIRYSHISKNDIVIIGGGGLFNYNPWFNFNVAINRVLDLCDNVVVWGAGFNSGITEDGNLPNYEPQVDFSRFALYGIRDKDFGDYNFVPCASSMSPLLEKAYHAKPNKLVGSILRDDKNRDEKGLYLEGIENITHYKNYTAVIDFIADHEYIVTTSYHGALWATLSNRKVIVPSSMKNGFKYNYYGFSVKFINNIKNNDELHLAMQEVRTHPGILQEYRTRNYDFFEKVKDLVRNVIRVPNKNYEYFYRQNEGAEHYFQIRRINRT
jgi:hypothetical protein